MGSPEDIGAWALAMAQDVFALKEENARLCKALAVLEEVRRVDLRFTGVGTQVLRVALNQIWDLLGAQNQTEAVIKLKELLDGGEAAGNPFAHGVRPCTCADNPMGTHDPECRYGRDQ